MTGHMAYRVKNSVKKRNGHELKIGVLGGTFDPVHNGHLVLAEQMSSYFNFPKVLFIPSNLPPHKEVEKIAPIGHRIEMLKLAIKDNDVFEMSVLECEREGMSYSYETIGLLEKMYPPDTEFYFIVGSDVLYDLETFKNFEILSKKCSFATAVRPGANVERLSDVVERLGKKYGATIYPVPFHEIDISSTMIRERIASGKSVRYLTPEAVLSYIMENKLYMK